MKNQENPTNNYLVILLSMSMMFISIEMFSQGGTPPPPGVPLDFGILGLIAACLGYGVKSYGKNEDN